MHGLGHGNALNDNIVGRERPEFHQQNLDTFDRLMKEFDTGTGFFKNTGQGPYSCPERHAMTLSINKYQKGRWGYKLAEHGWTQVAAYRNLKETGSGPCFIYFRARKGSEYVED